jgi:signal transduction histidine kinase
VGLPRRRPPSPVAVDRALNRAAAAPLRRELALALARAGQTEEARELLRDLLTELPPDAETLGLVGRINKDLALGSADAEEARALLRKALAFYLEGYRRDGDAYCGINAASLHVLLGQQEAARGLAAEVLEAVDTDDAFWRSAIQAEAALLLGRAAEATMHYAACARQGAKRRADLQSVWTQARRLCAVLHGDAGCLDACFGEASPEPEPLTEQLQALRQKLETDAVATDDSDLSALRLLARELLRLQEEQRHALSRELHDNIAQLLAVTTNRIALARSRTTSKTLRNELADVREIVETVLQEVGDLSRKLRPSLLDHAGLGAALEKHASAFRDRVKMDLTVECHLPSAGQIDGEHATNLFRIVQEALHNIEKHARATEARIALLEREGHLCLEVADNGCSFHPRRAAEAKKNGHLGLVGMRERAEMLGGTLEVEAKPGNGTVVRATVPMNGNHQPQK